MKYLLKLSILSLFLGLIACDNNNPMEPDPDPNVPGEFAAADANISLSAQIDGNLWEAEEILAAQTSFSDSKGPFYTYSIFGRMADQSTVVNIGLTQRGDQPLEPGTYDIKALFQQPDLYEGILSFKTNGSLYALDFSDPETSATLTITKSTATETAGSFELKLKHIIDGYIEVSSGEFKSNNYKLD